MRKFLRKNSLLLQAAVVAGSLLSTVAPNASAQQMRSTRGFTLPPDAVLGTGAFSVAAPRPSRNAGAQQHLEQELKLAADYFVGRGMPRDLSQSLYWYRKAAEEGDPAAQVEVGYFHHAALGVPRDDAEASRWYQRAASSGSVRGKLNLASLYLHGEGVRQSNAQAFDLIDSAARSGDGTAEAYLGLMYYFGVGTAANQKAAEKWFRQGVKHHSAEAEFDLGSLYSIYPGHAQDPAKAARLLRSSAEKGYVPAKHSLGLLLVRHPELPQRSGEAVELLSSAADAGSWRSSMLLGILARDGQTVPRNGREAYRWFRVAYLQGGKENESFLSTQAGMVAKLLTDEERDAVETEAAKWFQAHPSQAVYVMQEGLSRKYYPMGEVVAMGLPEMSGGPNSSVADTHMGNTAAVY